MAGYFDKFDNKGIPFMEGATKGDISELLGRFVEIAPDYGFINSENGRFGVFHLAGDGKRFYFAPSVITSVLDQIDRALDAVAKARVLCNGQLHFCAPIA